VTTGPEHLVIITGLSGAGKSYVQGTLEDLGFYCVDNLPMALMEPFLDEVVGREGFTRIGIVIDVRTHAFAERFPGFYRETIKGKYPHAVLLFLEATDEVLARRYSETRRPHPLGDLPIVEAIESERKALDDVRSEANLVLDTSQFSVHELKALIVRRFEMPGYEPKMLVTIVTFGFKHGIPYGLDVMFDVRFLPNPHFVQELRPMTGRDPEVRRFLEERAEYATFREKLLDFVEFLLPRYESEMKSYLTIGVGCTGGRHRSVAVGEDLRAAISSCGYPVEIVHRDCSR